MIKKIKSFCKKNPYVVIGLVILGIYLCTKAQENFYSSSLPVKNGLVGHYTGDSADIRGKTWKDISGNNNHAKMDKGSGFSHGNQNGKKTLKGDAATGVSFPTAILPKNYTFFYLSRYIGGNKRRIFQGKNNNWLSGHWGGKSGMAYHEGWITDHRKNYFGNGWVLGTDQNKLYRANAKAINISNRSRGVNTHLAINVSGRYANEKSEWEIAEAIVFNRHLNDDEMTKVEGYLAHKYNHLSSKYKKPVDTAAIEAERKRKEAEEKAAADKAAADKAAADKAAADKAAADKATTEAAAASSGGGFCTIL